MHYILTPFVFIGGALLSYRLNVKSATLFISICLKSIEYYSFF